MNYVRQQSIFASAHSRANNYRAHLKKINLKLNIFVTIELVSWLTLQFHLIKSITLETLHSCDDDTTTRDAATFPGSWWWLNILTSKWLHLIKIIFLIQSSSSYVCCVYGESSRIGAWARFKSTKPLNKFHRIKRSPLLLVFETDFLFS